MAIGLDRDNMMQNVQGYNIPELEERRDVEELTKALKEGSTVRERGNAAVALGRLKDERGVESLIETLELESNYQVRGRAAKALGELGELRAVESLIKIVLNKKEEQFMRGWVAWALGELCDPKAIPALEKVANDLGEDEDVRAIALESIEKIRWEQISKIISNSITIIQQVKNLGINASKAIELLKRTQGAFRNKKSEVIELAEQLKNATENFIDQLRKSTIEQIKSSELRIQEIERHGSEVSKAYELLEQARDACKNEAFVRAIKLAEEAKKVAEGNKPELSISLPSLLSKVEAFNLTDININNHGNMNVTGGTITLKGEIQMKGTSVTVISENDETKENIYLIKYPSINFGKNLLIKKVYIRPKAEGDIPIELTWEYKDTLDRRYNPPSDFSPLQLVTPIGRNIDFDVRTVTGEILHTLNHQLIEGYKEVLLEKIGDDEQKRRENEGYKVRYKYALLDDFKEAAEAQIPEKILLYLDIIKKSGVFSLDNVKSDIEGLIGEVKSMYNRGDKVTSDCRERVIELGVELKKLT